MLAGWAPARRAWQLTGCPGCSWSSRSARPCRCRWHSPAGQPVRALLPGEAWAPAMRSRSAQLRPSPQQRTHSPSCWRGSCSRLGSTCWPGSSGAAPAGPRGHWSPWSSARSAGLPCWWACCCWRSGPARWTWPRSRMCPAEWPAPPRRCCLSPGSRSRSGWSRSRCGCHVGMPAAPGPARAVMAGVAVNVGFYGLWRTLALLGAPPAWLTGLLLVLAGLTALLGIAHAAVQPGLQRVIAYSSVENSGLILAGYGVARPVWPCTTGGWPRPGCSPPPCRSSRTRPPSHWCSPPAQ